MELKEFMQKFCVSDTDTFLNEKGEKVTGWNVNDFPKALQNFADRICYAQRENCAEAADDWFHNVYGYTFKEMVSNAEMPKIEEL
jgi:hypothetical protein